MIRLFNSPTVDRAAEASDLLDWAEATIGNDLASAVEIRLAGVATRMALEFQLAELCRLNGPPTGTCWHNYAVRPLKAGLFTMSDYRAVRRIARLAAKAVHGKPFDLERARRLFAAVQAFVIEWR